MLTTILIAIVHYLYFPAVIFAILLTIKTYQQSKKYLLKFSLLILFLSFVISRVLGFFIYTTRPFVKENVQPLIPHVADNGFPSDHTLLIMTLAVIVFTFDKKWGLVLSAVALLTGASRVLAKVHQPIDILGSIAIAILVALISYSFLKKRLRHKT